MNQLAKPRLLTLVVNERSGGGRAGRILPKVARRLREQVPTAELHIISSSSWTEAEKLTRAAALEARPGDALLVMGGDGMAHLGLNAAAGTEATLGLIPAGTGNDFARGVGVPRTVDEAVGVIVAGRTRTVDLAHISNDTFPRRYVGAVVSTGYDARVNRSTNHIRLRLGALSYGYIAMRELASFSPLHYDMIIDGVRRRQEAMLVAVSNTESSVVACASLPMPILLMASSTSPWSARFREPPCSGCCRPCIPGPSSNIRLWSSSGYAASNSPVRDCS